MTDLALPADPAPKEPAVPEQTKLGPDFETTFQRQHDRSLSAGQDHRLLSSGPSTWFMAAGVLVVSVWFTVSSSKSAGIGVAVIMSPVAGWMELRTTRIPNWLTLLGFILGVGSNTLFGGWHAFQSSLFGAALGLLLLLPFVLVRALGAGAWKLAGSLGACIGPRSMLKVLIGSIVVAGVMAITMALYKSRPREPLKIPYGVALALTTSLYAITYALGWIPA